MLPVPFCSQAPAQKPAWDSPASPFKGTLRAVNFKQIQIYNAANSEFCTDVSGLFLLTATPSTPCNTGAGEIYQAVSKTFNQWNYRCNSRGQCGPVTGSLEHAIPVPGSPGSYRAPGIGFEHLETHDHPSVRGQN